MVQCREGRGRGGAGRLSLSSAAAHTTAHTPFYSLTPQFPYLWCEGVDWTACQDDLLFLHYIIFPLWKDVPLVQRYILFENIEVIQGYTGWNIEISLLRTPPSPIPLSSPKYRWMSVRPFHPSMLVYMSKYKYETQRIINGIILHVLSWELLPPSPPPTCHFPYNMSLGLFLSQCI